MKDDEVARERCSVRPNAIFGCEQCNRHYADLKEAERLLRWILLVNPDVVPHAVITLRESVGEYFEGRMLDDDEKE